MKTKYVHHGLVSLHVNFHNNRTIGTVILIKKICRWAWGRKKEPEQMIRLVLSYADATYFLKIP